MPLPFAVQGPSRRVVREREVEQQLELLLQLRRSHFHMHLHSSVEIAIHHVGASDVEPGVGAVLEAEDAGMLEKASDDAADLDPLTELLDVWPQAADAPYDQVDAHAFFRCFVEGV